jgi:outer membrane protein, heavy metal efflux system
MCSNYALLLGIALSVILTSSPVGANPTDKKMPLTHLEYQNQVGRDPNASDEPTGTLVLPQALALALTQNPDLAAFSWGICTRETTSLQARFFPNPTFGANAAYFGYRSIRGFNGDWHWWIITKRWLKWNG